MIFQAKTVGSTIYYLNEKCNDNCEDLCSIFASHGINVYFYLSGNTVLKYMDEEVYSYDSGPDFYENAIAPDCLYVLGYCPLPEGMYKFVYDIQRGKGYDIYIYLIQDGDYFYDPNGLWVHFGFIEETDLIERELRAREMLDHLRELLGWV